MHLLCPAYSYADMCVPTFGKYISYSRPINSYKEYPYTTWLYFLLGLRLNGIGQRTYNLLHLGFSVTTKLLMWLEDTFEIGFCYLAEILFIQAHLVHTWRTSCWYLCHVKLAFKLNVVYYMAHRVCLLSRQLSRLRATTSDRPHTRCTKRVASPNGHLHRGLQAIPAGATTWLEQNLA